MKKQEINLDQRIYFIKFAWMLTNGKFITTNLAATIKEHDTGKGIEFIKTFDPIKDKFVRISKADILRFHSYDTESTEILTNHSYFK